MNLILVLVVSTIYYVHSATLLQPKVKETIDDPNEVVEKWTTMEKSVKVMLESVLTKLTPVMVRASSDISYECSSSMLKLVFGLKNMKLWAFSMLDASGKLPSGILSGSLSHLGTYQQCVEIKVPDTLSQETSFTGQYCTLNMEFPLPTRSKGSKSDILSDFKNITFESEVFKKFIDFTPYLYFINFRLGLCVPSTCSATDLESILNYVMKDFNVKAVIPRCETQEDNEVHLDNLQISIIVLLSTFALLVCLGTGLTCYAANSRRKNPNYNDEAAWEPLAKSFCLFNNAKKILSNKIKGEEDKLTCLHGVRFYSMTWVILGHTYLLVNFQQFREFDKSRQLFKELGFQVIINGTMSVDSFFLISGVLVSYICLDFVKTYGKEKFNPVFIILHRIWRLLPSAMIVLSFVLLLPTLSEGPLWHEGIDFMVNNTRNNWWTVPIFATNLINASHMCMAHYWYIAADMQMFLLAMIYVTLLLKKRVYGLIFNAILLVVPIALSAVLIYVYELPPTILGNNMSPEKLIRSMKQSYVLPHTHLGPYSVGLALGYFLSTKKELKLSKIFLLIGWACAIACNLSVVYGVYQWNNDTPYTELSAILYGSLHRTAWAAGLAWVVFACVQGHGGLVNRILCFSGLIPLSKLTYLAYLIHVIVISVFMSSFQGIIDTSNVLAIWTFFGYVVVTFGLAFICRLLFEGPLIELEKLALNYFIKVNELGSLEKLSEITTSEKDKK